MFRPKWQEVYWYLGQNEQERWTFMTKACENDWMDLYHISMGNCYHTKEEAIDDVYEMLSKITQEDGYAVWQKEGDHQAF